jgi:hypothetical protein
MRNIEYHKSPSPHLVITDVIDPALYNALSFPDIPRRPGAGRIGRDIYPGEPEWDRLVKDGVWEQVHKELTSKDFIFKILENFADDIKERRCGIDLDKVYLEDFTETREQMRQSPLSTSYDPNSLFVRFDFQASDGTHGLRTPHVDHLRRIVGGVIFFSDAAEEGIEGGDFAFWADRKFRNDRICHEPEFAASYPIKHNTAYLFLNSNDAFHGPLPITKITGQRKWLYYSISSRRDIWPFNMPARTRIKQAVTGLFARA